METESDLPDRHLKWLPGRVDGSIASKADLTALSGLDSLTIGVQGDDFELFLESQQNFRHLIS